ncbi:fimbrial protein [Erwinia sorbitola]|uniref:Fimbrial protein n=1 Tax=Erwinia sorbitola TaxID=2681984 RepID=A0A6I6EL98_9GAMM|nr:fimbrial protein [Erwinia sorbitola]MTD28097.1 fimbrial protein [Erwinia sorbitola]QGU85789.1 fimbrial protein [Erwinia sorbitola]
MKRVYFFLVCFMTFPFISIEANSAMFIYPMEVAIGKNGASQIKIISQDDSIQFIKVSLKKVVEPGTKQEHELPVEADDSTALILTPQKIALSAGSERIVRLVSVIPPKKESTWRAYFESVNEDNFLSSASEGEEKNIASIGVNIIWGALIHVAPEVVIPSLKINADDGQVINDGTVRIPVKEWGECGLDGQCQWKKKIVTIYPDTGIYLPGMKFSADKKYRVKYINWLTKKMEELPLSVMQAN